MWSAEKVAMSEAERDELVERVIIDHHKMRKNAGVKLRARLEDAREERARRRREVNLTQALGSKYMAILRERVVGATLAGKPSASGWGGLEEFGDVDRRMKLHSSTAEMRVVQVGDWVKQDREQRAEAERLKRAEMSDTGDALADTARSMNTSRFPSISPRGAQQAEDRAAALGLSRTASPRRPKPSRGHVGSSLSGGGSAVPLTPRSSTLTEVQVHEAEWDFAMMSYGETHVLRSWLAEQRPDFGFDLSHRKTFVFELLTQIARAGSKELSFADFVAVVYGVPREEAMWAARRFSPKFGWAVSLPHATASVVTHLWTKHTKGGAEPMTFQCFRDVLRDERSLDERDIRVIFSHLALSDPHELSRAEFAGLFVDSAPQEHRAGLVAEYVIEGLSAEPSLAPTSLRASPRR
jgi:hypothetical protein